MNNIMEQISKSSGRTVDAVSEILNKMRKEETRDGVDLVSITKKLSAKKFGKK